MVNGSRAKICRGLAVKVIFRRSKILTPVAALDTAPMRVTSPCSCMVTCGSDCDVRTFVGLEEDDVSEFSVSSSNLTALVCYTADVVAVAMNENTVATGIHY